MKHKFSYSDFDAEVVNNQIKDTEITSSESKPNFYITRGVKDIVNLLLLSKKIVLTVFFSIVLFTSIYQFMLTPRYQTAMLLELTKPETQNIPNSSFVRNYEDKDVRIGNLLTLIKSRFIMGKVFDDIKENKSLDFDLSKLAPEIDIVSIPNTDLLKLVVSDTNPKRVKFIADSLVETFFHQSAIKASMIHTQSLKILSQRIAQSKENIEEIHQKIIEFQKKDKNLMFNSINKGVSVTSKQANSIIDLISQNEVKLLVIQNQVENLNKFIKDNDVLNAVYQGFTTPKIKKLFDSHIELEAERISLQENYKGKHPKIMNIISQQKNLESSIKLSLQELKDSYNEEIKSIQKNNKNLNLNLGGIKQNMIDQSSKEFEMLKFDRDLEISKKINHLLVQREKELELSDSVNEQEFIVIEKAQVPTASYYPRRLRSILLSILISIVISFIIIIISDFFSPKVLSTNDIERIAKAPVLKVISKIDKDPKIMHNNAIMVFKDLKGHGSEAFRHLRSKVEFSLKRGSKTMLVTSPNESDGKTFISINLAMAFAIKKKKVLLVDADLRKSSLSRVFKDLNPNNYGLSEVLAKKVDYSEVIVRTLMHGLDIVFSGERVAYPTELLEKENLINEFLLKADKDYDLIIIDSPKAYLLSDPMVISSSVENVLLVSSHGSSINDVYYTSNAIKESGGNIIGCILNKMTWGPGHQSSYYYYY